MRISKDTQICVSLSEHPGMFGSTLHNGLYKFLGLDYIYKPMYVSRNLIRKALDGLVGLGIKGCSLSSPYKQLVFEYLGGIHETALKTNSVNTILNNNGSLTGYNTDYLALGKILDPFLKDQSDKRCLVVGAGGAAYSFVSVLLEMGFDVSVCNRSPKKLNELDLFFESRIHKFEFGEVHKSDIPILINATSVGLTGNRFEYPIWKNKQVVFDVVNGETDLYLNAKRDGLKVSNGREMAIWQALYQFEIYTGIELNSIHNLEAIIESLQSVSV